MFEPTLFFMAINHFPITEGILDPISAKYKP
uniref:Uncharacterized protein n=1 Tax=Lepeophtheirus salmonis TaxID=72036 RepID=A0A0K2UE98_LEPSM